MPLTRKAHLPGSDQRWPPPRQSGCVQLFRGNLCCALRPVALGLLECLLEGVDSGGTGPLLLRISLVSRQFGIDELHAKQLIFDHFQKRLDFLRAQFYGDLLHG
jgi:hypothetical protein